MIPSPNDFTMLPFASNLKIEARFEPAQLFAPHRSATQMLTPSLSISTALVDPHVRPSGSFAHPAIVSYGFGRSLVGAIVALPPACAPARLTSVAAREIAITKWRPRTIVAFSLFVL
jgi:hypothetical protein